MSPSTQKKYKKVNSNWCHKSYFLTDIPVVGIGLHLHLAYDVPDAGHPVGQQGEHGHQQRQDHRAVLRVAVHLLEQTQQTEETDRFQEVNHGHLEERKTSGMNLSSIQTFPQWHTLFSINRLC